jgi:hypothetical protein
MIEIIHVPPSVSQPKGLDFHWILMHESWFFLLVQEKIGI